MNNKKIRNIAFVLVLLLVAFFVWKMISAPSKRIASVTFDLQNNGATLLVDGKPYLVKGVCYSPMPIGKDYEYNFWGDPNKPWLTDGKLMKEMGVNTVRFYRAGKNPEEVRRVIDDLYDKFGIRSLMGSYLGFWNWPPPNYADKEFTDQVRTEVLEMVRLYKDNPGVLMWVLGNENNYSFDLTPSVQRWTTDEIDALPTPEEQRKAKARIYYSFINDLAKEIKKIDNRRPVVMSVGETTSLDIAKEYAPDIDVIGIIAYRGPSFGNLFRQAKQKFDKPVLMIEWGADSFHAVKREPDEESQAEFLKNQWQDIERNAGPKKGTGNAIGGTLFEWNDEWWKGNENLPHTWSVHDEAGHWNSAAYYSDFGSPNNLNMNEEWWGVVSLDPKDSDKGLNRRIPKKSYEVLKSLWTKKS